MSLSAGFPFPIGCPDTVAAPLLKASSSKLPAWALFWVIPGTPFSDLYSSAGRLSAKSMLPLRSANASALGFAKAWKITLAAPGLPPQELGLALRLMYCPSWYLVTMNGPEPTGLLFANVLTLLSGTFFQMCSGRIDTISRFIPGVGLLTFITTVYLSVAFTLVMFWM